jgi:hypothetical protein
VGQPITISREGQRVYFAGDTFAAKDRIKGLGGHWDAESRRWWVGLGKLAAAEALVASAADAPAPVEDLDDARVHAKVKYRGRTYFVIAETGPGPDRVRLATLKGADTLWADAGECELLKTYQPRESGYGRYRRTEHTTLGSLRRFVEKQERAKAEGMDACPVCGKRGPLHHDLEDGMDKCYGCCDIPE